MINSSNEVLGGGGLGGLGGGGQLLEGLIFGALLGNRGGLLGGNSVGAEAPVLGYQAGVLAGENAKYRDVVDAQTALTAGQTAAQNALSGQLYATQNDLNSNLNNQSAALTNYMDMNFDRAANVSRTGAEQTLIRLENGFTAGAVAAAGIREGVQQSAYNALLQSKDLSAQMAAGFCALGSKISEDGALTRAQLTQAEIRELQNQKAALAEKLEAVRIENDFNSRGLYRVTGSTISVNPPEPCHSSGDHIRIVNENVAAVGSTVGQLSGKFDQMINLLGILVNRPVPNPSPKPDSN